MKRLKSIIVLLCCFLLLTGFTTPKETNNDDVSLKNYLDNGYSVVEKNDEFVVIGKSIKVLPNPGPKDVVVQPMSWPGYSSRNFVLRYTTPDGSVLLRSVSINKGTTHTFTVSNTRATTVSGSLAIGGSDINIGLGYGSSNSVTLSDSFTYTCPSTYTRCELKYYPDIAVYWFDEYFLEMYQGTHEARVLSGFYQTIKFYR